MLLVNRQMLLLLLCWVYLGAALGDIGFFSYGASSGDLQLMPDAATSSAELSLDTPFVYYGKTFNSLFVSVCGGHAVFMRMTVLLHGCA